ncbi:three-helix bundle dimerization domain-containing protein [Saccharopolyspora sp. NPDC003752]
METIDHERLERELELVNGELSRMFPTTPRTRVSAAVDTAAAEFVPSARVATCLPILIRRRAQRLLSGAVASGGPGPRRSPDERGRTASHSIQPPAKFTPARWPAQRCFYASWVSR